MMTMLAAQELIHQPFEAMRHECRARRWWTGWLMRGFGTALLGIQVLLQLLFPRVSWAAAPDIISPRAMGMGGALRASAGGTAGALLNPAGMSISRQYVMGALYQYRGLDSANQLNATIVDSFTSRIAAGLSYSYVHASPKLTLADSMGGLELQPTVQTHEVDLALSTPLGSWLLFGVNTKYINHQNKLPDDAPAERRPDNLSVFSLDVGGILRLGEMLRIAVVGYNLIPVDDRLYPTSLGLGSAVSISEWLTLGFDSVLDFTTDPKHTTATFHGGLEAFLAQQYALRTGVQHSMFYDATYLAAGLGLITRALALELSIRQQLDGGHSTLISAGIQYFVQ